tara:strand:+ start:1505 stop:1987 length:483 start_codon:yes stop_codon:yes gene_type:complete
MAKDKDNINHLVVVSDKSDKLTLKQEHFCQLVAEGQMLTEAYRTAYNVGENTKPSTVWTNASNLAVKNTKVALRIKELTEEITARNRTKEDQLKIWVTEKLKSEAVSAETDSARISALVALGKSVAMFTDNVHQETKESERSAQDIEADLQRRIAALMGE